MRHTQTRRGIGVFGMSLIRHDCNENEITEIVNLIKNHKCTDLKFTYDQGYKVGYIWCKIKAMILQFKEREPEGICYFSLQINSDSYDVNNPTGELLTELRKILNTAKDEVHHGLDLKVKISRELSK